MEDRISSSTYEVVTKHSASPSGSQLCPPSNQAHTGCWRPALLLSLHCSASPLCPSLSAPHVLPSSGFLSTTYPSTTYSFLCLGHHAWFFAKMNFQSFLTLNSVVFLLKRAVFLHFSTLQIKSTCSVIPWMEFITLSQKMFTVLLPLPNHELLEERNNIVFILVSLTDTQSMLT